MGRGTSVVEFTNYEDGEITNYEFRIFVIVFPDTIHCSEPLLSEQPHFLGQTHNLMYEIFECA